MGFVEFVEFVVFIKFVEFETTVGTFIAVLLIYENVLLELTSCVEFDVEVTWVGEVALDMGYKIAIVALLVFSTLEIFWEIDMLLEFIAIGWPIFSWSFVEF